MQLDVLKDAAPTEVGSYFVANYPPFSAWSKAQVTAAEALLASPAEPPAPPLGLYLHIPFCRKRCRFCYFRVYTDKNGADVDAYLQALANEVVIYKQRPRLAGREFDFVYFGGGTPSFLSSQQLMKLVERINRSWRWDNAREVTFECEPGTLQKQKLETIRQIGTTRLSLGVEHFDDAILESNGRAHRSAEIFRAYDWAREVGFPQINIDLIAGMVGDDEAKWKATIEQALRLSPDSVTIYQMELPHNTVISREARESGHAAPVADWATKRAWVDYAFTEFERAGYVVSSGYTVFRPDKARGFVYRDALWHGGDLVGTGVASFSHVGGVHFQNADRWEDYLAALQRDELPLGRALPTTPRQRLIRELVLQLKLGRLDLDYFDRKFGGDVRRDFRAGFDALVAEGFATMSNGSLALTRAGLLRVDALLPRFFEAEFQGVRYT